MTSTEKEIHSKINILQMQRELKYFDKHQPAIILKILCLRICLKIAKFNKYNPHKAAGIFLIAVILIITNNYFNFSHLNNLSTFFLALAILYTLVGFMLKTLFSILLVLANIDNKENQKNKYNNSFKE